MSFAPSKGHRPQPSPWLTPTRLLVGMIGIAMGFMVFSTLQHKDRIQAALHHHHTELQKEEAKEVAHARTAQELAPAADVSGVCSADHTLPGTELWGAVVVPGLNPATGKGLTATSAQDCCQACAKAKGCNRWVYCHKESFCQNQCWLKRVGHNTENENQHPGNSLAWTSGIIPKDYDIDPASLPPVNTSITTLLINTAHGQIRIALKPEWSQGSVAFVRRLAAMPELCSPSCQFYRAEPGFLLQGSLRAYIPANMETKNGPKFMERGEIGWAGGGAGPDWFIYLGTQPATHFGYSHTVWGKVEDEQSLSVVEKIVMLPATAPKPGDMHMLNTFVDFTIGAV